MFQVQKNRCWLNGLVGKGGSGEVRAHIRPFGLKGCALPQKRNLVERFWFLGNSFAMLHASDTCLFAGFTTDVKTIGRQPQRSGTDLCIFRCRFSKTFC